MFISLLRKNVTEAKLRSCYSIASCTPLIVNYLRGLSNVGLYGARCFPF